MLFFLLAAYWTKSILNSMVLAPALLSLPFFKHGNEFSRLCVSEQISTVRRYVLRLARGTCKCVCKTKLPDSCCPKKAVLRFLRFSFYDPNSVLSIVLWSYCQKWLILHTNVLLTALMSSVGTHPAARRWMSYCIKCPCGCL